MGFGFSKDKRITESFEISKLFREGECFSCCGARLFLRSNGLEFNRVVFTLSRKYGTAVERNRSKRLSRECYRLIQNDLNQGFDFSLLVYPGNDTFLHRKNQIESLFSKAGILIKN